MPNLPGRPSRVPAPLAAPLAAAAAEYPTLAGYLPRVNAVPGPLEFFPPGETASPAPGRPVLQAPPGAKPADVAGDLVSHWLGRGVDPTLTRLYGRFVGSLTPAQHHTLQGQYQWAQQHEGEQRPYQQWAAVTGVPAYFRGLPFDQWPATATYTPAQRQTLGDVLRYLHDASTAVK